MRCIHGRPAFEQSPPCPECVELQKQDEAERAADPEAYGLKQMKAMEEWVAREARKRGWLP